MAICAILSGHGGGYREIGRWVEALPWEVAKKFGCSYIHTFRTPSEPTLRRSLQGVNGQEVAQIVANWLKNSGQKRAISKICSRIHHLCRVKTDIEKFKSILMRGELS